MPHIMMIVGAVLAVLMIIIGTLVFVSLINISEKLSSWFIVLLFAGIILFFWGGTWNSMQDKHQQVDACSQIGGRYVVVGKETTHVIVNKVPTPTETQIYGCAKP